MLKSGQYKLNINSSLVYLHVDHYYTHLYYNSNSVMLRNSIIFSDIFDIVYRKSCGYLNTYNTNIILKVGQVLYKDSNQLTPITKIKHINH